jgi:hypothetical protein
MRFWLGVTVIFLSGMILGAVIMDVITVNTGG